MFFKTKLNETTKLSWKLSKVFLKILIETITCIYNLSAILKEQLRGLKMLSKLENQNFVSSLGGDKGIFL